MDQQANDKTRSFCDPDFLPLTALASAAGSGAWRCGSADRHGRASLAGGGCVSVRPAHGFFYSLTPEAVLDAVEAALGAGARATGRCLVLNSLENRVYDVELEDGGHVIGKFYRPGRWGQAALLDEHRFLHDLQAAEVPAVAPLLLAQWINAGADL